MPDAALPRPDTLLAGRYRLVRRRGVGGMGEVWEAEDTVLERRVAVKLVVGDRHDPAALARFEREARTGARLVHPNLATVYDYGEADQGAFLVMELLAGETLAERLRQGPLPADEAAHVVAEAAEALAVAHAAGVTHRDVKPSNLMLTGDATKVMDFGIATGEGEPLTATGLVIGTANYLAPERVQGASCGPEADVYALGAVLVEAITGARAFDGSTPGEVALSQIHADPPDLTATAGVPAHIAAAAHDALAKDPAARPSAIELAARLREPGGGTPGATTTVVAGLDRTATIPLVTPAAGPPPHSRPATATARPGRGRQPVLIALLLLFVMAAGGAYLLAGDDGAEAGSDDASVATTAPAGPTTPVAPTTAPPATTVPVTTTPPAPAPPPDPTEPGDEGALASAAVAYVETLARGDYDTAWALTSPAFQAAQDRSSWEGFWGSFATIEFDGEPRVKERDARVDLPLRFDGRPERYRITFVPGPDGSWLVDGPVGR